MNSNKGVLAAAVLVLGWAGSARGDVVLDWNGLAAQLIVGPGGASKVPPLGLVDLAIVHTAIYDAVNAAEGFPFEPYGSEPTVTTPASAEAAAARAGRDVLLALYPSRSADIETLYASSLAAIPDGPAKDNGIDAGQQAAAGILALRVNDGRNAGTTIVEPPAEPGVWIRTPPGFLAPQAPWAGAITPWTLKRSDQFRPEEPPALDSTDWVRDYDEVKALGPVTNSTRTAEQTDIGRFWGDQPMLQWNRAWRGISTAAGLSVQDNARFFAMLAASSSDALIACWDAKYHYMFWRPVTAIRTGGGNPALTGDPSWLSLVTTPNHPEYPPRSPPAACCRSAARASARRPRRRPATRTSLRRSRELVSQYSDLPMDYADATLVALAEELSTSLVFTTDRRDFAVYRIKGRRRFEIVPG
ncbi:MAG: PA-phosphatase [Acidobacteria bacterium]|nr:MAG: PA-phosphatase [Acidobacteriota bacterium]